MEDNPRTYQQFAARVSFGAATAQQTIALTPIRAPILSAASGVFTNLPESPGRETCLNGLLGAWNDAYQCAIAMEPGTKTHAGGGSGG